MPDQIDLGEGRGLFGLNPVGYDDSRPDYPAWIYQRLLDAGALDVNRATLEIGAGNGLATRGLLEHGADPLTIVEPDERFAPLLLAIMRNSSAQSRLVRQPFEDARLPPRHFDLVASATAFHWIDQPVGLRKVARLLRPGGFVALWWNVFQDLSKRDAFHEATRELLSQLAASPSGAPDELPFGLDRPARERDLAAAGFIDTVYFESRWTLQLSSARVTALYEGFSSIQRLPQARRVRVLEGLAKIAEAEFDGQVERNMTTCLYLARCLG
jgi:SAM-dependent methyltransferase